MRGSGVDPAFVVSLIERLPSESAFMSMLRAEQPGIEAEWKDFLGKDENFYVMAAVYDALNQNTAVSGHWKKKPPKFDPYPRPELKRRDTNTLRESAVEGGHKLSVRDLRQQLQKAGIEVPYMKKKAVSDG